MKLPHFKCSRCSGKGRINLTPTLFRTLRVIDALGQPSRTEIHTKLAEQIDITAVHRRVERLLALNLVREHQRPHGGKVDFTYSSVNGS
jgi:DNA-binding MarR family transcriptional regulator